MRVLVALIVPNMSAETSPQMFPVQNFLVTMNFLSEDMLGKLTCCQGGSMFEDTVFCVPKTGEPPVPEDAPHVFEVVLLRDAGKKLGVEVETVASHRLVLTIACVMPNTSAADWNRKHEQIDPLFQIRRHDRIVMVNGASGNAVQMKRALSDESQAQTKMTVVRLPSYFEDADCLRAVETLQCAVPQGSLPMSPIARTSQEFEAAEKAVKLDEARKYLPSPWVASWSQSQGKYYFFNPNTRESTWRKPSCTDETDEGNGSIVGTWVYADGSYRIQMENGLLRYHEESSGVHGIVREDNGWLLVDLLQAGKESKKTIGRLRLIRRQEVLVSNLQRAGNGGMWDEDIVATKRSRAEKNTCVLGVWSFKGGSFTVTHRSNKLIYEQEQPVNMQSCLMDGQRDGWVQGELFAVSEDGVKFEGWVRLQRQGHLLVCQRRKSKTKEWETAISAVKEKETFEGEWEYNGGIYTISNRNGKRLYEEASCGLYGVLKQESSGWLEAELFAYQKHTGEQSVGWIRVQRRGKHLVSQFCENAPDAPWEEEVLAIRHLPIIEDRRHDSC